MIEPDFLDELARFDASTDRLSTAVRRGDQRSPRVGDGLTFSDYRRYVPGDDTRLVDWNLYARTDEYFVKRFEEERESTVHVLLDASASMGFGDENKFEFGAKLGLGFAYLALEEHDQFRVSTFRTRPERLDSGRSTREELLRLVDLLNEVTPEGEATVPSALEAYAPDVRARSLVVVVSDFLAAPETVADGLAALPRSDVLLVHVLSPDELDPPATGDTVFADVETDRTRRTYFDEANARQYRSRVEDHVDAVGERARTLGANHAFVSTGTDFFDAFSAVWVG